MQEQKLTGYPSIDKPWMKYYSDGKKYLLNENDTIYNNFVKVAIEKANDMAFIDYLSGKKTTYKDLLEQANELADSLCSLRVKAESVVGFLGFNCMFEATVLLGVNKIGATTVFLDPGEGIPEMKKNVDKIDILFVENNFVELEPIVNTASIPTIIIGNTSISLRNNCISYNLFLKQRNENAYPTSFEANRPAIVIFSSGSTGLPKPIVHTNYSVNMAVRNILISDFPLQNENFLIKAIPSHIGLPL